MHVLLVAGAEADAVWLTDAWVAGSPRSVVEHVVIASPRPHDPGLPAAGAASRGVFVPTSALGLSSVTEPPVPVEIARLRDRAASSDLVVVHVEVLDGETLRDGRVADSARAAEPHAMPVVVLAGRSEASRREWSTAGVSGVHEVGDDPADVAERVARVARTWAPDWV